MSKIKYEASINQPKPRRITPLKARSYAFIVYDEVQFFYARRELLERRIPFYVSPLHIPANNKWHEDEESKPHWHFMILMPVGEQITFKTVDTISHDISGASHPVQVSSISRYARYLTHLDDPDKQQFTETVQEFCGVDSYADVISRGQGDEFDCVEIIDVIETYDCRTLPDLIVACRTFNPDFVKHVIKHTYFFNTYMRDRKYAMCKSEKEWIPEQPIYNPYEKYSLEKEFTK